MSKYRVLEYESLISYDYSSELPAIKKFLKLSKKMPTYVAILADKKSDALKLNKAFIDNFNDLYTYGEKAGLSPKGLFYLLDECNREMEVGQPYFHDKYGSDQVHPFDFG